MAPLRLEVLIFREQESALARIVERKRDPGQVGDRDVMHVDDRAAADSLAGGGVQAQFARTNLQVACCCGQLV